MHPSLPMIDFQLHMDTSDTNVCELIQIFLNDLVGSLKVRVQVE